MQVKQGVVDSSASDLERATDRYHQGLKEEASAICAGLLQRNENHVGALCLLALIEHQLGKHADAFRCMAKALSLRVNATTLSVFGIIAQGTGNHSQAECAYRQALELAPHNAEIHNELALVLGDMGREQEAEAVFRGALELNPDFADAHNNLGVLLKRTSRRSEAFAAYRRALQLDENYAEAHNNVGVLYKESGQFNKAEAAYRRALTLKPDYADARWNLGMVLLPLGRYEEGWECYEARYHRNRTEAVSHKPDVSFPQWHGESLCGRSLLVWTEQGLGDCVQFARYLPLLKRRGVSQLTVVCPPVLGRLLETADGVDAVISSTNDVPTHDFWVFPLSLPKLLSTSVETIPHAIPYLRVRPDRVAFWGKRIHGGSCKVGLVWKGNPSHDNDRNRSLPSLSVLAPLLATPGIRFYSLQKGCGEDEVDGLAREQPIVALGPELHDFSDTAAVVTLLDLVISVDTSVAHVAGALGTPCWVLLPKVGCDWRWMLDRSDSPWYPKTMRLFRQVRPSTWDETIAAVTDALGEWKRRRGHHAYSGGRY